MQTNRRTVGAVAAALVVLALYASGALSPPPLPGDDLGWRRFQTPAIESGLRLGETFAMNADGLNAIDIQAVAAGEVRGRIRLELQTFDGVSGTVIRSADVNAADLVRGESYRFEFAPVPDSRRGLYRLELAATGDGPTGVALMATKGERFPDGTMIANGVDRWADLAFEVHSTRPPPPPAWINVRNPRVQFTYGALALSWIAIVYALRQLAEYDETLGARRT